LFRRTIRASSGVRRASGGRLRLLLVLQRCQTRRYRAVRPQPPRLRRRADIEGHVWRALASAPDFAARVRAGCREDTWYGTAGVPGYFRRPYGKGWALVGD